MHDEKQSLIMSACWVRYGRTARDPMFLTMLIALEMESFPSTPSIVRHSDSLDVAAALQETQWLWDGTVPHLPGLSLEY